MEENAAASNGTVSERGEEYKADLSDGFGLLPLKAPSPWSGKPFLEDAKRNTTKIPVPGILVPAAAQELCTTLEAVWSERS